MKPNNKRTLRGKAAAAQASEAKWLLSTLLILTAAVWMLRAAGLTGIMHITSIPMIIEHGALAGHITPALFMMGTSILLAVIWLWGVAMSRKMALGAQSIIGMAVVTLSSVLAIGFDVELLNGFHLPPDVMMRYDMSREYVFMLLDIAGLGLFILPTQVGGGLKVLFALYPLTGFLDNISYPGTQAADTYMEQQLTTLAVVSAIKVIYAAIVAILAFRWRKAKP